MLRWRSPPGHPPPGGWGRPLFRSRSTPHPRGGMMGVLEREWPCYRIGTKRICRWPGPISGRMPETCPNPGWRGCPISWMLLPGFPDLSLRPLLATHAQSGRRSRASWCSDILSKPPAPGAVFSCACADKLVFTLVNNLRRLGIFSKRFNRPGASPSRSG